MSEEDLDTGTMMSPTHGSGLTEPTPQRRASNPTDPLSPPWLTLGGPCVVDVRGCSSSHRHRLTATTPGGAD